MANLSFSLLGDSTRRRPKVDAPRSSLSSNLQKSLHLLDNSVAVAPSLFRDGGAGGIGTPPHRRRTLATNLSTLHPGVGAETTFGGVGDRTFAMPSTPNFKAALAASVADVASGNAALLLEENNDLAASTSVFSGFLEKMRDHPMEHQVFELISAYEEICADQVSLLTRLTKKMKPGGIGGFGGGGSSAEFHVTLTHLENERSTWQLVKMLYTDRLTIRSSAAAPEAGTSLGSGEDMDVTATQSLQIHVGEKEVVDSLFESDAEVRQAQIVVDWLEALEKDKMEDYYEKVEYFTDKAEAWENTLHSLRRSRGGLGGGFGGDKIGHVTELDPDASTRQKKPLAELDREDESRLQRYLFALIRSGQFDKAQSVCHHVGQSWKAATLEGWRLHNDSNFTSLCADGRPSPIQGNPFRRLWKNAAWVMSEDDRVALYERALFAALTGNLNCLLKVVDSWEDALWAYCRALVDQRTEEALETRAMPFAATPQSLPPRFSEKELTIEQVFEEMEKINWNKKVSQPSKMQQVQSYIISGDVDGLLDVMHGWLTEDMDRDEEDDEDEDDLGHSRMLEGQQQRLTSHLIRFMAHLVLFLRSAGLCDVGDELGVRLLLKYVEVLITSRMTDLVATYTSHLPSTTQVEVYAAFLEGVTEDAERRRCLELARESRLDVRSITKMVVENIRQRSEEDAAAASMSPAGPSSGGSTHIDKEATLAAGSGATVSETETSPADAERISSLDWLLYDPGQRAEALSAANALCRGLLLQRKIAAARQTFSKLPVKILEEISNNWEAEVGGGVGLSSTSLPPDEENAIREYFCIKSYLEAIASFDDWFQLFHRGKPEAPSLPSNATFTEKVAHEQQTKSYALERERWQLRLDEQTNLTVERIYNVLLFVDGGWMVDARSMVDDASAVGGGSLNSAAATAAAVDAAAPRYHQMARLREQCLPGLAVLLHSIFHSTNRFHDCLHLADVIAADKHALFKVFRKAELVDFLQKLRTSALALLEQDGVDSFGYPV